MPIQFPDEGRSRTVGRGTDTAGNTHRAERRCVPAPPRVSQLFGWGPPFRRAEELAHPLALVPVPPQDHRHARAPHRLSTDPPPPAAPTIRAASSITGTLARPKPHDLPYVVAFRVRTRFSAAPLPIEPRPPRPRPPAHLVGPFRPPHVASRQGGQSRAIRRRDRQAPPSASSPLRFPAIRHSLYDCPLNRALMASTTARALSRVSSGTEVGSLPHASMRTSAAAAFSEIPNVPRPVR